MPGVDADRRRRAVGRQRRPRPGAGRTTRGCATGSRCTAGYVPADRLRRAAGQPRRAGPDLPQRHRLAERPPRPAPTACRCWPRTSAPSAARCATASTGCSCRPDDEHGPRGRAAPARATPRSCAGCGDVRTPDLSGPWAHYVGALEALAPPSRPRRTPTGAGRPRGPTTGTSPTGRTSADGGRRAAGRHGPGGRRWPPALARCAVRGLPGARQVDAGPRRPARVDPRHRRARRRADADEARRRPRARPAACGRPVAAWAALGALAAIVRVRDDGRRSAVIVDESGSRSPAGRGGPAPSASRRSSSS